MSGFNLRAMLDEPANGTGFLGGDSNGFDLDSLAKLLDPSSPGQKTKLLENAAADPSSAFLLNTNIWENNNNNNGTENDFNLEYMDLDEFLNETGLTHSTANLGVQPTAPAPPQQNSVHDIPTKSRDHAVSHLEALLRNTSPVSENKITSVNTIQSCEKRAIEGQSHSETDIVKKRKYSVDGEGLADSTVITVPGKEGFDPAAAKFTPDELKPQPIIKKSKKTYVPDSNKDEKYWKRRNKNNVAAKRSRDARRAKENQIIMRAGFLEDKNDKLVSENKQLKQENEELRLLVKSLQGVSSLD